MVVFMTFRSYIQCIYHVVFEEQEDPASRSFFSEIIASISDIKFSPDGRYIISRDYLTLKIWDVNMEARPVQTIHVRKIQNIRYYIIYIYHRLEAYI